MPLPSAPNFTTRVPIQFISVDAPALSITGPTALLNNPSSMKVVTGSFAKIEQDIDGIPHYRGDGETPPFAISLEWKILGYNDYVKLANLQPYYVTFITYRNIGYYGRLVMDGPEAVMGSADTVHATGTFYPLTPSDNGGAQSVSRIATPTTMSVSGGGANSGGIPNGTTTYYWLTFSSAYGETLPQSGSHTTTSANSSNVITWTWPASTAYCEWATVYCSSNSSGSGSRIAGQIPNGLTAQVTDYVGYSGLTVSQKLPQVSTAYRGRWQHGIWYNET